ncbi:MAG TPA: hypothetical protein VGS22_15355 [Thermoanaerobaculia bacterium]|jgi:hypothetical protein|nr:hypothetical protein [Thermoanaerobaculia bacterium]
MKILATILSVACLVLAIPSFAADCAEDKSPGDCWRRLSGDSETAQTASATEADQETQAEEVGDLLAAPTGQETGGESLLSTTKNFLPLLAFTGLLSQGDAAQGEEDNFIADLNFLLPGGLGRNAQLQAVFNSKPKLASPITDAVDDEREATLTKRLTELDDITATFSYQWEGLNRGRSFERYRNRYEALIGQAKKSADAERVQALDTAQNNATSDINRLLVDCAKEARPEDPDRADEIDGITDPFSETFDRYRKLCGPEAETKMRSLVAQAASTAAEEVGLVRAAIKASGLDRFGELVDNQPQLFVTAKRRDRDPLVGGNETSGKVTFEWARTNLAASMPSDCHRELEGVAPSEDKVAACADRYRDFVAKNGAAIANGNRFSFAFEFADVSEAKIPLSTLLPGAGLADLTLPDSSKRIFSLGWSRDYAGPGSEPIRLDLVANYDDVSGDPIRRDRLVASLTLTRKINGFSVPLGIVYANHGEFLGDVDQVLSAHLGLKFDLFAAGGKPTP